MKKTTQMPIINVILGTLAVVVIVATKTSAQTEPKQIPLFTPNVELNVKRTSGNCPKTVGLWWIGLPYEGGAEHTVVADTVAFTNDTKLVPSDNQYFVEFVANLNSEYVSCIGKVQSPEYVFYNLEFKQKKVYFRVDLRHLNAPGKLIVDKTVAAFRPYVRWAIAD